MRAFFVHPLEGYEGDQGLSVESNVNATSGSLVCLIIDAGLAVVRVHGFFYSWGGIGPPSYCLFEF